MSAATSWRHAELAGGDRHRHRHLHPARLSLCWIIAEKVPPRLQRLALVLAILPFWTSYVVRSYSWLLVLANNGIINETLLGIGLITMPVSHIT